MGVNQPKLAPYLASLGASPSVTDAVRALALAFAAQDKHGADLASYINANPLRNFQAWAPYAAAAPLVVPTFWASLTLSNGWVAFGGAEAAPQYRIDTITGEVITKGLVKSGTTTTGTIVAAVPSALAPSENRSFAVCNGTPEAYARLVVENNGTLVVFGAALGSGFLSLATRWEPANSSPGVPSCFPFDLPWSGSGLPSFVVVQAQDVSNQASPVNLALTLPDWVTVTSGGKTFIRIRNVPGLAPSKSYAVQAWAF